MFGRIIQFLFHTFVYVLIFFGLVWLLLGITPTETYVRSRDNLGRLFGDIGTFMGGVTQAGKDMKSVADSQLQQASDRFHGKDPYEKVNSQLTSSIKR